MIKKERHIMDKETLARLQEGHAHVLYNTLTGEIILSKGLHAIRATLEALRETRHLFKGRKIRLKKCGIRYLEIRAKR